MHGHMSHRWWRTTWLRWRAGSSSRSWRTACAGSRPTPRTPGARQPGCGLAAEQSQGLLWQPLNAKDSAAKGPGSKGAAMQSKEVLLLHQKVVLAACTKDTRC